MLKAITRKISPRIHDCELTHMDSQPIDFLRACSQHDNYVEALKSLSVEVIELATDVQHPDCVFVEDTAIVLDEIAIITRPGAKSRQGETSAIKQTLKNFRECIDIVEPGKLDGGDVLVIGKEIYVGLSSRSNQEAITQLSNHLSHYGYRVQGIETKKCLHLKTAVTALNDTTLLINPEWIDVGLFGNYDLIYCNKNEPFAANILKIGDKIIAQPNFKNTNKALRDVGFELIEVDNSELAKAEAGLTCCSIVFKM